MNNSERMNNRFSADRKYWYKQNLLLYFRYSQKHIKLYSALSLIKKKIGFLILKTICRGECAELFINQLFKKEKTLLFKKKLSASRTSFEVQYVRENLPVILLNSHTPVWLRHSRIHNN